MKGTFKIKFYREELTGYPWSAQRLLKFKVSYSTYPDGNNNYSDEENFEYTLLSDEKQIFSLNPTPGTKRVKISSETCNQHCTFRAGLIMRDRIGDVAIKRENLLKKPIFTKSFENLSLSLVKYNKILEEADEQGFIKLLGLKTSGEYLPTEGEPSLSEAKQLANDSAEAKKDFL